MPCHRRWSWSRFGWIHEAWCQYCDRWITLATGHRMPPVPVTFRVMADHLTDVHGATNIRYGGHQGWG